jgi:hypothetical protein
MGSGRRNEPTPVDWTQVVGELDEWDKKNLTNLINNFMKEKYTLTIDGVPHLLTGKQLIDATLKTARAKEEASTNVFNRDTGIRDKDSGYRVDMSIPTVLLERILEAYPMIMRDDRMYAWFCKHFGKIFAVRGKI